MSATLEPDDRNPRAVGPEGSSLDCFMCWDCGHVNYHRKTWCMICGHGRFDKGEWRMRLCVHELILAVYTQVPGAVEAFDELEQS